MTPPRRNALDPQLPSPTPSLAGGRPVTSDLSRPEWFINRELSLLEFNRRVLDLAKDQKVPLLERLKYLCIVSSNLDEFFEVRVAGLKEQVTHGAEQRGADGLTPSELLSRIAVLTHQLVHEQYHVLNHALIPKLADERIRFLKRVDWMPSHIRWMRRFFWWGRP